MSVQGHLYQKYVRNRFSVLLFSRVSKCAGSLLMCLSHSVLTKYLLAVLKLVEYSTIPLWSWFSHSMHNPAWVLFLPQLFSVRRELSILVRWKIIFICGKTTAMYLKYVEWAWYQHKGIKCFNAIGNWVHYIDAAIDSPICDVIDFLPTLRVILEKKVHFFSC